VDSPGIDVSVDLDGWIDQQCLDADVFVLVVNAESTLTKTEKEFFHKVSERLSKPNVFILNNRWDATAYELERVEEVKAQHVQRNTEFLCNELKVCTPQEVSKRIYFVSAREVLFTRTQTNPQLPPGYQSRLLQFEWFESEFEKCISMSAVKTKFDQPSQRGKAMTSALKEILENSFERTREKKSKFEQELQDLLRKIEIIERKLQDFTQEMKDRIRYVMEDVEKNVSLTLNDEIKKIYNLIDQYERPFHPEENQLNWYKRELHKFVEQKLGSNLSSRLNSALLQNLELTQKEIRSKFLLFWVSLNNYETVSSNKFLKIIRQSIGTSCVGRESQNGLNNFAEKRFCDQLSFRLFKSMRRF
jgi:mitofusin